ncbi:MAG TPA: hypothetical protein VGW75_07570 [Solirubrobacteraceae bacterium]|nr:hypothetical protein [Solirubrobacteraceae bacterium]
MTDTGGLEAVSSVGVPVRVDCTAPTVGVDVAGAEVVEGEVVEPVVVGSDSVSGLSTAEVEVRVDDGGWEVHDSPVVAEAGRSYAFRGRASDVAGNASGWVESGRTVGVAAPPADEPEPDPDRPEPEPDPEQVPDRAPQPTPAAPAALAPPLEALRDGPTLAPPTDAAARRPAAPMTPAPARPKPPSLRITRVLPRPHRTLEVAGTAAVTLAARATLTVRTTRGVHRRRVAIHDGRWRARIRTAPRARIRSVLITTPATPTHAPGRARWRPPRTKRTT